MSFLQPVKTSQTLLINQKSKELENEGKIVYKFGFGQSPFSPPTFVIDALSQNANQHYYTDVQGIFQLREAVSKFYNTISGMEYDSSNIIVAPGSKMLLYTIMASFSKLDVIIPRGSWVSYGPQAELLKHNIIWINTEYKTKWKITPESLEKSLKTKKNNKIPSLLILNYPSNPLGVTYNKKQLKELVKVLRKYNCYVLSDEIYSFLTFNGEHYSIAEDYKEKTIITSGLSKWCGAGGWRLGLALLPKELSDIKQVMLGIASETYSCATLPVQLAATKAYQFENVNCFLKHQRRILKSIGLKVAEVLNEAGLKTHPPEGGFYVLPDFSSYTETLAKRGIDDSEKLCNALLTEATVALLPGTAFGFKKELLVTRLSYVNFDGNKALAYSKSIEHPNELPANFLENYAENVLKGLKAIISWVKK